MTNAAYIAGIQLIGMHNKMPAAFGTLSQLQHLRIEEAHQKPCARDTQRRFIAAYTDLLKVQPIALDQRLDAGKAGVLHEELMNIHEQ